MEEKKKKLVLVVEGNAALGPYWRTILSDYLLKLIRSFCDNGTTETATSNVELALVTFNAHGPYSPCLVHRSGWTRSVDYFLEWLSAMHFSGGGISDAAIAEGFSEVLMMFSSKNEIQIEGLQRHCILVAASNPYPLPTPVYRPPNKSQTQLESCLSDAETLAKLFPQCFVSLSVICPRQLPKLKAIYNAGKRNPSAADRTIDIVRNKHYLVLISETFMEACAALHPSGTANSSSNQSPAEMEVTTVSPVSEKPPPASILPVVNESLLTQRPVSVENIPPTPVKVKVEPSTVSSPLSTCQEMKSSNENVQDLKPVVSEIQQSTRPGGPPNVNILNNLSQARLTGPTGLAGGTSAKLSSVGGNPMAMHMPSMISGGTTPSGQSSITPMAGSATLAGLAQVAPQSIGVSNNMATNVVPSQTSISVQSRQSKYAKVWEGDLWGRRQGKHVFIVRLEAYRSLSDPETLAEDWPSKMLIDSLLSQGHMCEKQCAGKESFVVFRAMNHHGFLGQLQEKKLCTLIRLPSQTLLMSVSDKAGRLIGKIFPGMVVFKPQISGQQQPPPPQAALQQQQQQRVGMGTNQGSGVRTQLVGQGQGSSPQPKA